MRMVGNVGFDEDIAPLFTDRDKEHMEGFLDLSNWATVSRRAQTVLSRVDGTQSPPMPPPNGWPPEYIALFRAWMAEGTPKRRGDAYASFFRDLDSYTEYFDVYGRPAADNYMPAAIAVRNRIEGPWMAYAIIPADDASMAGQKANFLARLRTAMADPAADAALKRCDALLMMLIRQHFGAGGAVDFEAFLDCLCCFGRDILPEDPDRLSRIAPDNYRQAYALRHTMDGSALWFSWCSQAESSILAFGEAHADHPLRVAMLAAASAGSAMDYVFRQRETTRGIYYSGGEPTIFAGGMRRIADYPSAVLEAHELWQINQGVRPAGLVAQAETQRLGGAHLAPRGIERILATQNVDGAYAGWK